MINKTAFRSDINGLRALAVLAVVLYHFGVPGFSGGFVGVDIFFVISGFLMTGIIVSGLERGRFSIWAFYLARARRILPALIVLCATLCVAGWWWLTTYEYKMLGRHAVSSVLFVSNLVFFREAGYFDSASHDKWLLHTWSLSVEWQFYVIFPLALALIWRYRPNWLKGALVVGFVLSLALCVVVTNWRPSAAFFLLPTRGWEMLAGGLVCVFASATEFTDRTRRSLELAGLVAILFSTFLFTSESLWPGWLALLPVAGTVSMLLAGQQQSKWTGNLAAQWLGSRSYSIYLWHWPLVVTLAYFDLQGSYAAVATGIGASFILGHLSFVFVENFSRIKLNKLSKPVATVAIAACAMLIVIPAGAIFLKNGILGRLPPAVEVASLESANLNPRLAECHGRARSTSPACIHGGNHLSAILIGDSHGNALVSSLAAAAQASDPNAGVMELTSASCPTMFGVQAIAGRNAIGGACSELLEWAKGKIASVPKDVPLVIVNRTSVYALGHNEAGKNDANVPQIYFRERHPTASAEALKEISEHIVNTACSFAKDRPVYMVNPIPEMGVDVPKLVARGLLLKGEAPHIFVSTQHYQQRHAMALEAISIAQSKCGVRVLDPALLLCKGSECRSTSEGRPIYYDDNHMSEFGNKLLIPMFAKVFQNKLAPLAPSATAYRRRVAIDSLQTKQ